MKFNRFFFVKMAMYGTSANLPDRTVVGDFARIFLDAMLYIPEQESNNVKLKDSDSFKN